MIFILNREKESKDPAVRKIVEENYKMILERQRVYDTNMRKRVKDGTATEKEKNMTERKKQKNLNYYYRVRKPGREAAKRSKHFQSSTSAEHPSKSG